MKMTKSSLARALGYLSLAAGAFAVFCCAHTATVAIPPVVELSNYAAIGLVEFVSQPPGQLGAEATRKFINNLHAAQPGIRILEIGSQENVLRDLGYDRLDFQSIRAIGERFGVAAVVTGAVELSEPQTDIRASTDLGSLSAGIKAKVNGRMSAELWETASGATTWSNSSSGSWTVGGVSFNSSGEISAGYNYPKEKQDQILTELVTALNGDFWPSYERRNVRD